MRWSILLLCLLLFTVGCNGDADSSVEEQEVPSDSGTGQIASGDDTESGNVQELSLEQIQSNLKLKVLTEPWSGDLDGMVKRRVIRVLTVYGLGRYFLDGPQEKGIVHDMFKEYQESLNKELNSGPLKVYLVFIPVARDELIPGLVEGRGDIAAAGLTITPEREELVDFSTPVSKEINEVLVTGPSAPVIKTLEDLGGHTVRVRESSSYYESLQSLNKRLEEAGKPTVTIETISELLEDEDLLEMVHAGLLPWVVVDDYKAQVWTQVFDQLVVRSDLVLRSGGYIGYAFRKDSPQLAKSLNDFLNSHRAGTMLGNVLINRNIKDYDWVKNALHSDDFKRFQSVVEIFQKYGEQYGMDYLMVAAQGYQESRLDQSVKSHAGAIGIMQLLPSTAADPNVGIPDIHQAESNIHAGIKYLDFIRERYFNDPGIDRFNATLLSFASYNAGPARVQKLQQKAKEQGLNPNVWFGNVEVVAGREIGRETVQYVANIYKYYITYRMASQQEVVRDAERKKEGLGAEPGTSQ